MMLQHHIKLLTAALLVSAGTAVAAETNDWSFDILPYLWVANLDVETSLPSLSSSAASSADHFDTRITAGAMIAAEARYKSVGLFMDFAWLRLDTEANNPGPAFSSVDLKSDFIHTTAALTYRLPLHGKFQADVLAGARLWYVSEEFDFKGGALPGFKSSADQTWADPMIGANLRYDISKRWFATVNGMVGGFGVSSDLAWEVFAGVGFRITDWCSTTLGYRYLHEDYSRENFNFNLEAQGVLLGFGFHF